MPTRKQRRRRQKDRRHEYEYVYVDDSGQEVEVDEPEAKPGKADKPAAAGKRPTGKAAAAKAQNGRGAPRKIDPPSWQKVFRRAAIFAPLMAVVVYLLNRNRAGNLTMVVDLVVLLLFFLPFSYAFDSFMYRNYRKRIGDPIPPRERKPRSSK
jgi:hypothetical protein